MASDVEFICCDMPEADRLTIHIMAAMAEKEATVISERTKAALDQARKRGKQLGNPNVGKVGHLGVETNKKKAKLHAQQIYPIIKRIQASGILSLRGISRELSNRSDCETAKGGKWSATHVTNILKICETKTAAAKLELVQDNE